jgi:hypothetical protein
LSDEPELDEHEELAEKLAAFMDEHENEYGEEENIRPERRLSLRPDLNAFLLLDKLFPGDEDVVVAAKRDVIFLSVEPHELMRVAGEEDILDLIRCGVFYDRVVHSLAMFV